jgi:predicted GH43/DUF377 family glycosyl hydrolase
VGATPFAKPEMWLATSPDLVHWGGHEHLLGSGGDWDIGRVGAGAPPIRTGRGWLAMYHGNSRREETGGVGAYSAGLLLLNLDDPRRILAARGQVFVPEAEFELEGFVPKVVFPTGIVEKDDILQVYYGAADTATAMVEFSRKEALSLLK